jgi:hypothetical protein
MRQHQTSNWLILYFLFSTLALSLTGCGGQSETPNPPTPVAAAPTEAPAPAEATALPAPTVAAEPTEVQPAEAVAESTAEGEFDARSLPRFADAEVIYEDEIQLIYVTPADVATVADFSRQELAALGWQEYTPPFSQVIDDPNLKSLAFKKDGQGLSAFITVAPAQGNKTSVQYSAIPLETDLPALADAAGMEFSDKQLYLGYTTASDFDAVIAFYREQLAAPEWQEVTEMTVVEPEQARLVLANQAQEMALVLDLTPAGDGRTKVTLQPLTDEALTAVLSPETPTPAATEEAELAATEEAEPAVTAGSGLEQLPLPTDAQEVTYDTELQEVTFTSTSNIDKLVEFYRQALPAQGWTEDDMIGLVDPSVAALEFAQGDASLSLTMLNFGAGENTEVTMSVSGLLATAPDSGETTTEETEGTTGSGDTGELTAEDKDGLPVPDNYENFSDENSPYRRSILTDSPANLKTVLEFYERELSARGWRALPSTVGATDTEATQLYENEEGQLDLRLTQNAAGGTDINLVVKMVAAAKKAEILPPSGQARIYFGNLMEEQVVFKINQKEVKVEVQEPTQNSMEGVPFMDLPPGKHDFTLTIPGEAPSNDQLEVGPDEVWGLIAGPGGAFPLQLY